MEKWLVGIGSRSGSGKIREDPRGWDKTPNDFKCSVSAPNCRRRSWRWLRAWASDTLIDATTRQPVLTVNADNKESRYCADFYSNDKTMAMRVQSRDELVQKLQAGFPPALASSPPPEPIYHSRCRHCISERFTVRSLISGWPALVHTACRSFFRSPSTVRKLCP